MDRQELKSKEGVGAGEEEEGEDERLHIDHLHPEQSYAFSDAKRKLRLVLSTTDAEGIRRNVLARVRMSTRAIKCIQ